MCTLSLSGGFVATLLLAGLAAPAPGRAQKQDMAQCADCVSASDCALVNHSGANSCTVTAGSGCRVDLSLCIIAMERAARELRIDPREMRSVRTGDGVLALAPVGDGRYAAWNCAGGLRNLYVRSRGGHLTPVPVAPWRDAYAYARMVRRAAGRA